jgi:hypothetical protein
MTEKSNEKANKFLRLYGETCNLVEAAKKAGLCRASHYRWLKQNEAYREAFKRTQQLAREVLESELVKRATKGWTEPIYYQGQRCGSVRRFDGATGMALLRGMWPEKYGIQRTEIKTEISGSIDLIERLQAARKRVIEMRHSADDDSRAG